MVAIHIEHKLDAGILTISQLKRPTAQCETEDDPGQCVDTFQFRFECGSTGAWFDADLDYDDFIDMCPILGEFDELLETLNEPPTITTSDAAQSQSLNQNILTATFKVAGKRKTYYAVISLTRRTYAVDKQDIMELRAENAVLRRKVAGLENDLADVREICEQFRMDIAHLAILANNRMAYQPVVLPDGWMSDDILIKMMSPVCKYRDATDPTNLLNLQDDTIVRAIDRGVDPNKIIGRKDSQTPGMPLLFMILHNANAAGDIVKTIDRFNDALKLIKYLISVGVDVNIKYEDKTILTRFIEYDAQYPSYSTNWTEFNAFSPVSVQSMMTNPIRGQHYSAYPGRGLGKCIEYIEVRNAILKTLRDAGAK